MVGMPGADDSLAAQFAYTAAVAGGAGEEEDQDAMTLWAVSDPVSYTHLTLPTILRSCRSRWSPYH